MSGIVSTGLFASLLSWVAENFSPWKSGLNLHHLQTALGLIHKKLKLGVNLPRACDCSAASMRALGLR